MREAFLPFALPDLDESELCEIQEALESGWITTGPKVRQFETEFATYVGTRHAIAVNSCTAAMHLALEAIGLQRGDLVLTTPYTFAATAEVIRYFDAVPMFVDIEADTLNINPNHIAEAVRDLSRGGPAAQRWFPPALRNAALSASKGPKSIIPVHVGGHPCDMEAILKIAHKHELAIIEDAAHALPARCKGHTIGSSSLFPFFPFSLSSFFTCFSFYATKTLTTGEGGMITTDDDELAERCRIMSLHGVSKDAWKRYTAEGSWYYEIIAPGFKYNMTDVAAAMGLAQLRKVERMWKRRREIAACYTQAFSQFPELEVPTVRPDIKHAWQLYVLRLNVGRLNVSRNQFIEELKARSIGTSVHFIPLHLHPYYRETYGYQPQDFPVAYREYQRAISLPIYSRMSDQDVQDVVDAVVDVVGQFHR
jgi:dTDP-4-amino-4,6-dideoxygalactose transaminase